jgi:peptidoglycan/xylan/chitin deacetylase (PgdA/CDA1 family)
VRGSLAGLGGVLAAGGHALPALTTVRPFRLAGFPALSGLGRPDHVALTFDDGPDAAATPAILAALDRQGWQATFFMLGRMVERNPEVAAEVAARGHEIALHGYDHVSHLRRSPRQVHDDLRRGRDLVAAATGQTPRWFRPPYGVLSSGSCWVAARLGLRTVLWTAWGRDWRARATGASVTADVRRGLRAGATVLLHDSDCTSAPGAWKSTEAALPELADLFAGRGLAVGPLREHEVLDGTGFRLKLKRRS